MKHMYSILMVGTALGLAACSMESPTTFSQSKPMIEHERIVENHERAHFDEAQINMLAAHYNERGEGPLELTVTYDPKNTQSGAMKASQDAAGLVEAFRNAGVSNVKANILPVKDSQVSKVMVAYDGYNALAPEDCEMMSGYKNRNTEASEDYKLGCTVDTLLTKQIVRPKDLGGQAPTDHLNDGQRTVYGIQRYRSGVPNEALGGETASGE